MAGKRQKRREDLQNQRGERGRTIQVPAATREPHLPPCPRGITPAAREAYNGFKLDSVSRVISRADWPDVRRYFVLLSRRETLEMDFYKEPVAIGTLGGKVANPLMYVIKELTREIEKLREQLGILPLSRQRLGVAVIEAHSSLAEMRAGLGRSGGQGYGDPFTGEDRVIDLDSLA